MGKKLDEFQANRLEMNEKLIGSNNINIKRFFALDERAYDDGALSHKTKELLGLSASLVSRCDDCITYHLLQCHEAGVTKEEFLETLNIGLIVGGSVVIPHARRAIAVLDELDEDAATASAATESEEA
ncbi:MAG: carboxymuconolactone decarboxylase family protein [Myxococcota bacterium]|nr:carboxymuconolactone decarboxylase family protein [Myxococcota bacterium]